MPLTVAATRMPVNTARSQRVGRCRRCRSRGPPPLRSLSPPPTCPSSTTPLARCQTAESSQVLKFTRFTSTTSTKVRILTLLSLSPEHRSLSNKPFATATPMLSKRLGKHFTCFCWYKSINTDVQWYKY